MDEEAAADTTAVDTLTSPTKETTYEKIMTGRRGFGRTNSPPQPLAMKTDVVEESPPEDVSDDESVPTSDPSALALMMGSGGLSKAEDEVVNEDVSEAAATVEEEEEEEDDDDAPESQESHDADPAALGLMMAVPDMDNDDSKSISSTVSAAGSDETTGTLAVSDGAQECGDEALNETEVHGTIADEEEDDDHEKEGSPAATKEDLQQSSSEDQSNNVKDADNESDYPDLEDILVSTEALFEQVDDKSTVTVKDIVESLQAEYNVKKFRKAQKKAVRNRLSELITEAQKQEADSEAEDVSESEDDADDEEDAFPSKRRRPPARKKPSFSVKKALKAKSIIRKQAADLRKKRLQALRVRNEEIQSAADQERAASIAAKFDTQTEEQMEAREASHAELVNRLWEQRKRTLEVVDLTAADVKQEEPKEESKAIAVTPQEAHEDDSDSSEDDTELEIVGCSKPVLSLFGTRKTTRELMSPSRKRQSARMNLKKQLKAKQREMGNKWLAQELGYSNADEHLKDCVAIESRKRMQVLEKVSTTKSFVKEEPVDNVTGPAVNEDEENEELALAKELAEAQDQSKVAENEVEESDLLDAKLEEESSADDKKEPKGDFDTSFTRKTETHLEDKAELPHDTCESEVVTPRSDTSEADNSPPLENQEATADEIKDEATSDVVNNLETQEPMMTNEVDEEASTPETSIPRNPEKEEQKARGPRNAAWKAMLQKEAEVAKKMKRQKNDLVEGEADEEEEEQVAGLEDFGFKVLGSKKKEEEEENDAEADDDDMDHVVDDLSDNEGDEEAGDSARKAMEKKEEKLRHKEMIRRMRDGYDGRRGGIAGNGARGLHRFDQLVAADDKESAKRLGILNEDELDSEDEIEKKDEPDEEEDEAALVDKMLKDRFLHRSSVEVEERFSDNEEEEVEATTGTSPEEDEAAREEREQAILAKRFSKRAQMQRLVEAHGHDEEFSRSRLIDEDTSLKMDLSNMKVSVSL